MEVNLPDTAKLEKPHRVGRNIVEAKKSFYELAKSKIILRTQNEHTAFEKEILGKNWQVSSAVYVISTKTSGSEDDPEKWVLGLKVSINKDFFGKENQDLIPYAVEHEVFEAWMRAKRGISPQSIQTRHLLARRRQFEMAMRDGKAEKLLSFYKKRSPKFTSELEAAYRTAKKREEKRRPAKQSKQ